MNNCTLPDIQDDILLQRIQSAIKSIGLDLQGQTVLTEAASGPFIATPLIAALAGAKKVIAVTKSSRWGSADEISRETLRFASIWNIQKVIEVTEEKPETFAKKVDIVTNLGFVRPLSRPLIENLPSHAAIGLMWEPWEYREGDIDLSTCIERNIPVIATNEHHPNVETFRYVGVLALKLLFEANVEVLGLTIAVIGSNPFGKACTETLNVNGAHVIQINPLESWPPKISTHKLDAIVIVEHRFSGQIIGPESGWEIGHRVPIIHICGALDELYLKTKGYPKFPYQTAPFGMMTVTTAYVGIKPVVDLHCAGLMATSVVARARKEGYSIGDSVQIAIDTGYALPLPPFTNDKRGRK